VLLGFKARIAGRNLAKGKETPNLKPKLLELLVFGYLQVRGIGHPYKIYRITIYRQGAAAAVIDS
jgi:hypothetical protein